jgi:hypothetical protein
MDRDGVEAQVMFGPVGLRLVMAESGLGWLPWIVQELDYRHWRL